MISEELFCKCLSNIKKQEAKMEQFSKALGKVSDGHIVFDKNNLYLESLLDLLAFEMDDPKADFISWWLWEDVEKIIYCDDGTEISVKTPSELYRYLKEESKNS